ncbi:hypothetical protein G6F43_007437 [Rhizopus delemar]|nr:hypothetical protein G6F43_007437 [Rhizopus delemar]
MHDLVNRLQFHKCNDKYCKRGDPTKKCRFGYPKPYSPVTVLDPKHRCTDKRDVGDAYVSNYNPYLLAVFRTSMDIQYNDGPQAVRYLAKYLAKDDYEAKILLKNIQVQNQGYYKRTTYVSEREHYSTRIVGAVEATYDIMGWRKHSNSRKVIFLSTSLLGQDTRRLRENIKDLNTDDTQIFSLTPVEIYEKRDGAAELTMPQFFASIKEYKPLFWRTYNQSEMNSESFYYQQIVLKLTIFQTPYKNEMDRFGSYKDYYEHLLNKGSIEAHKRINIESLDDIVGVERGLDICREELNLMLNMANQSQKSIFSQIIIEIYSQQQVFKLAPTGVAAHNTSGQTIHGFFGLTNGNNHGWYQACFFGDVAQLLPIQQKEGKVWESEIFNAVPRYSLHNPVRQQDERFIEILNKVRNYQFDESVVAFINERSVHMSQLPLSCLRLYTTRQRVASANEKDYAEFPDTGTEFQAHDSYVGNQRTAKIALRETRLLECLFIKPNMQVMLIHNLYIPTVWVNGTIALVEYMKEEDISLKKRLPNGNDAIYWIQRINRQVPGTSYTRTQFPIVPDFATTIYKAQSATIDCVGIHLDNMITHGQL